MPKYICKLPVFLWLFFRLSICLSVCCLVSMSVCFFASCPYVCLFVVSCLFLCNFYVVKYLFIKLNGFPKKSRQLIFVLLLNKLVVGIFKQFSECINYTSFQIEKGRALSTSDITVQKLKKEGYEAVFLGIGNHQNDQIHLQVTITHFLTPFNKIKEDPVCM